MRILIVASGNMQDIPIFVKEQAEALGLLGVEYNYFIIKGKGIKGYLKNLPRLYATVKDKKKYDLIHAHYGLTGMLSVLQRSLPVIITFHGSDIHYWRFRQISRIASLLAVKSIYASESLARKVYRNNKYPIIPCGINLNDFFPIDKTSARNYFNFSLDQKVIVFASQFDVPEKNYPLAKQALSRVEKHTLIELKGYTREEVNLLLNAADILLVTSKYESGPLIVKEAMACNCPIVSTDVGDVRWVLGETDGCYLTSNHPDDVALKIKLGLDYAKNENRTEGRKRIIELGLDSKTIASKVLEVYNSVLLKI